MTCETAFLKLVLSSNGSGPRKNEGESSLRVLRATLTIPPELLCRRGRLSAEHRVDRRLSAFLTVRT